ncbi:hypothetical protein [Streptomyces sp. A1136]|uniref:hypothetical protein n=1 Tax=Streptomyces sp. A1136 TaxID=2563102 RepID=UPI00109EC5AE|nr:hypothetical protein [Streptomyces sp. A1136]THA48331.1 hypothetical protein E6R62_29155 [Streptomyces sp. A1136]
MIRIRIAQSTAALALSLPATLLVPAVTSTAAPQPAEQGSGSPGRAAAASDSLGWGAPTTGSLGWG